MTPTLSESLIVWRLAEVACQRVSRKAIRALQKMAEGLQSGDDSGLVNTWEEICIQVQSEQSIMWDAYEETIRQILSEEVTKLPAYEREAIWLQTQEGETWDADDEDSQHEYPVAQDEVIEYLKDKYVYSAAGEWSNGRIRKYLEQTTDY
jgi:DNA phosphorothioation-dependent restriction protein DptG